MVDDHVKASPRTRNDSVAFPFLFFFFFCNCIIYTFKLILAYIFLNIFNNI